MKPDTFTAGAGAKTLRARLDRCEAERDNLGAEVVALKKELLGLEMAPLPGVVWSAHAVSRRACGRTVVLPVCLAQSREEAIRQARLVLALKHDEGVYALRVFRYVNGFPYQPVEEFPVDG